MKLRKLITLSAVVIAGAYSTLSAAPVLVGNTSLDGVSLSESDVKAVLLGKKVSLNGKRVVIVMAKASDDQETFLKGKVGKTGSQFNNHWRRLFMTGGGTSPTQVSDVSTVVSTIAATTGAIGIVDESAVGGLSIIAK